MKPTVISNAAASASAGNGAPTSTSSSNGITIPINHEYGGVPQQQQHHQQHPQYQQQQAYSPQQQQQQQQHPQPQQQGFSAGSPSNTRQYPAHFQQGFGFEPDMDDMFPRSTRLGRLHHDPFAGFAARKRCGNDPHSAAADGFSHYFDDDPDFGFPQFGSLGRRRAGAGANANSGGVDPHTGLPTHAADHDFFNRLPSEFRQYIPEGFGTTRRSNNVPAAAAQHQAPPPQTQYYQQPPQPHQQQHYAQPSNTPPKHNGGVNVGVGIPPQSPTKKLCDAAIQTEDPATILERSEVDGHHMQPPMPQQQQQDYLNQHGLRNTVDMGVKSNQEMPQEHRSHSAPPQEQLQQQQQQQQHQPSASSQFSTQTSPPNPAHQQSPLYQKVYYPPQQQAHPQQKQKSPPLTPQTPGGTYIRTIPIFVEGRSEPIINSHKEIPNQNGTGGGVSATATASARHAPSQQQQYQQEQPHQQQQQYYQSQAPHPQQQNRPTPLNTQQQQQPGAANDSAVPPQTPHTMDSINKIQDIQRDVLDLMSKVENFAGARKGKDYAYLDEMLTRNLLKLDTIDTNGKDSIRLARKEAIKCIQASINVLEAKAEENDRARLAQAATGEPTAESLQTSADEEEATKETAAVAANTDAQEVVEEQQPVDATQIQEPIPLPPPEGMQIDAAEAMNGNRVSPAKEMQAVLVPATESTESKME